MAYPYPNQQPAYGAPGGGGYGYGAPPGPPPPQQHGYGYGAAPPAAAPYGGAGYGAPPAQQHHHYQQQPAYHGAPQYGGAPAPPPPSMGHMYLGVPVAPPAGHAPAPPPPGFNAQAVVDSIRKATKGFGTDEKLLIATLAPLDAIQMDAVSHQFKATVGKDLLKVLEKETSGYFEACLRAKVLGPVGYDVWLVHRACDGAGTHEDLLNEVLLCRTNAEIWLLKQAYQATYHQDLTKVVEGELSMKTKRLFTMALNGTRMEENAPIDGRMVEQDAHELQSAARGAGTDEIKICGIMVQRSTAHLQAINQAYHHRYRRSLADMVASEFSGHMKDALMYIANTALAGPPGVSRDAALVEASMAGAGTKDERLTYRIMRAHWDRMRFEELKRCYAATQSRRGLRSRVEGETSGDFERMLVAVIGH